MIEQLKTIRDGVGEFVEGDGQKGLVMILEALTQLEAMVGEQEPKFWYRPVGDDGLYEGPVHHNSVGGKMLRDEKPGEWVPLFVGATPPAQQPQYEAGDMASAHNDGFRAGVASVAQQPQTNPDEATMAGLEASINILSQLVDEQRQLLAEVDAVFGVDAHGVVFEDGDSALIDRVRAHLAATNEAKQPQARPDFTDEWTGYLKDGETPFERFLRERKDVQSALKLYQRALEENERLKAQQPQAETVPTIYVSKGQLDNLKPDPEDTSGTYLPVRKSPKGKFTHPLFAAPPQAEAVPTVTPAMVDAYLKANTAYWQQQDELPKPPAKWINGTPQEATRVSLIAALAAAPKQANAVPSDVVRDAERLNYLQCRGATVELLPGTDGFYPMRFRVGGLHAAVSENIRGAIDAAMAQGEKP